MAAAARFAGRTAIVTGGSRGIGAGIARVLLREGANVVFCGHTAHATLGRALAAKAPQALLYVEEASDLCKPGACATLVDAAMARYGRVDLVVNNVSDVLGGGGGLAVGRPASPLRVARGLAGADRRFFS